MLYISFTCVYFQYLVRDVEQLSSFVNFQDFKRIETLKAVGNQNPGLLEMFRQFWVSSRVRNDSSIGKLRRNVKFRTCSFLFLFFKCLYFRARFNEFLLFESIYLTLGFCHIRVWTKNHWQSGESVDFNYVLKCYTTTELQFIN